MKKIFSFVMALMAIQMSLGQTIEIDPSVKEYYVKTHKTGKGDGSDWDNAMGSKDFSYVFGNLKSDSVTFYVAAGVYHAVYNFEGKETNDKYACWISQHGANIIGGYDSLATGNASTTKPNPTLHRTIFSGDLKGDDKVVINDECGDTFENFTDNMTGSMFTMNNINSDVHISGIELTGMNYARQTAPSIIYIYASNKSNCKVTVDNCKIYTSDNGLSVNNVWSLSVDKCEFINIRNSAIFSDSECRVSNSTFSYTGGVRNYGAKPNLRVTNSTFVKNDSDIQVFNYGDSTYVGAEIYNNTFISCKNPSYFAIGDNVDATIEGNIFAGTSVHVDKSGFGTKRQNIKNNLFACKDLSFTTSVKEKNNIKLEDFTSVYKYLLDGTYSASDSIFSPNLEYNGSTTRTVALLRDSVSGMSIRFPRLYQASEDQRGAYRLKSACMGSYELGCASDTVLTTAVSVVGSKFKDGKVYDKVGQYKNIIIDYKTSLGCDSVVIYNLNVIPDTSIKEFYVKTQKTGKGDGSDWDNAMGSKDFALVFGNLQTEGVTFYLAGGTYHPVYNYNGDETNDRGVCWSSQHGANIYGGYDPNATGNAKTTKTDPSKFRTIFSGDLKEDDKVVMNDDCDYTFDNFTDNITASLLSMNIASDVHIRGIELTGMSFSRGSAPSMIMLSAKEGTYKAIIDSCRLNVGDSGIDAINVSSVVIDHCEFDYILNSAVYSDRNMKVTNSTFTYTGGVGYRGDNTELVVENSTFVKNRTDIYAYDYNNKNSSTVVKVNNNTFISCKKYANFVIGDNVTAFVEGNIFTGSDFFISKSDYELKKKTYTNNLIAGKFIEDDIVSEKNNIRLENAIPLYEGIFDGKYSKKDSVFTPNLTYKDAYTRTVALLKDNLFDSISVRFPRLKTVSNDQRGTSRLNSTCMGAYELGCGSDTTSSTSKIMAGSKFDDGKVYDKVGLYKNVFVGYKTSLGCDSVVNYTLTVVPDSSVKDLYVKTRGTGKADGSDWDNAMGSKEFALVFENLQTEGVTFYMAAGVYHPVYDYYGKETNDKRAFWKSNYGANIYGGYDSLATGNASTTTPNPTLYRTIFSGDFNGDDKVVMQNDCYSYIENDDDNVKGSSLLEMSINGDVHISGVELTGVKGPRGFASLLSIDAQKNSDYKVTIDNCKLYNSETGIQTYKTKKLEVDKCEFSNLFDYSIISHTNCHISNSTFAHTGYVQFCGTGYRCDLLVENSTFIKNKSNISVFKNDSTSVNAQIYNNTFISCKHPYGFDISIDDNVSATVAGNIFAGTSVSVNKKGGLDTKQQSFENNLFACKELDLGATATEKGNIKLDDITSVYKYLLDGKYSESDTIFTPNLAYNGSSTRTVALLTDNLFDSISIRFPRLDTVSKDQRGVSRLSQTCMGAYELGCGSDTTFSTSIVMAGSKFEDGKVYDKIGRYENVFVGYNSSLGCDSVVNYTLTVIPDSSVKEIYVKTRGTGKADGSDWDNAMGSKDFALVFENLQTEGVTFYVAAGVYHAVYNFEGKETNDKYACWISQHGANIIGGYDSLATGNASTTTPNPTLYRTIFSGDLNGDDKVVMEDGSYFLFENFDDNMAAQMISMNINSDVYISGLELTGVAYAKGTSTSLISLNAPEENNYKVTVENCKFSVSDKGIQKVNVKGLEVNKCEFDYILNSAINSTLGCHIYNSTFAYTGGVLNYGDNSDLIVENSTFVKNAFDIQTITYDEDKLNNAKIYNNTFISREYPTEFNLGDNVLATVAGNIFAGTSVTSGHGTKQQSFENNLFAGRGLNLGASATEKGNIKLDDITSVYKYLLDGKYSESDTIFTPNLAYNGSSTRTVALLTDNLFDSISIRFPRLDTVSKDQRGVSRLNPTCMGAYELGCGFDTTFSTSIVMAGSKFEDGKVYDKIGRYENVFVGYNSSLGCDSVVNYTLTVIPDSSVKELYVKTRGTGKADGSDWDNAMGSKDFALVFENLQTEGVTFYVTAGVYHAVYDGYGKETNDKNAHWVSQHGANIIGGYDSLATGNASTTTPNPTSYRTIFSGDINGDDKVVMEGDCDYSFENFGDNMNTSMISMNINSDVHISGIELTGMSFARGTSPALILLSGSSQNRNKVTIDNCKLYVADKGISGNVDELIVDKCEFKYIRNSGVYSSAKCHVSNSTFNYTRGVQAGVSNYVEIKENPNLTVENSTFANNATDVSVDNSNESVIFRAQIYNNTFISCKNPSYFSISDNVLATVAGNIFAGTSVSVNKKSGLDTKQQSFANNLFACKELDLGATATEKGNIKLDDITSVYKYLLDGKYSESDTIFTPNLAYNGSSTRTVALLRDNLFDSISIRFPRLDTVSKDQRGVSRLNPTCMGAYEIVCIPDTTFDIRSIIVGSKFEDGKIYNNVGRYDNVISNVKKESDCDSVISYTLFVVPDSSYVIPYPSIKEYYVKTHKTGKGDGSDWDNAMGAKDFAFVFENLQTDGVTFYVAAGVYHAVYDGNGKETNDKNAHWVSQHGANIYGGYDSLTTGNATSTPNPTLYRTIFSGDLNGDDKVVMKGDCGCSFENFGDNMNTSMISMKVDCDVQISGIELTGMSFARGTSPALISLSAPIGSEYMVMIDNCKLSVADKGIQVVNVDEVHVFGCEFDYISNSAFYTNANCHVFNSTFAYTNGVICDAINSSSRIVNSTFVKNSQDVRVSDNSDNSSSSTGIYNNTFISCKNGGNLVVGDNVSASVVGNIFAGTPVSIIKSNYEARQQSFANNLFASKNLNLGETVLEEGNIKLDDITAIYKEILDGTYSESDSIFTPNLAYNESSTRTVALLRDNFSDETSIRFSRVADIDRDQRNVYRKDSTCMGAYEITKGDGVDDINSISFEIYPNPVKDVLSVIGCDGSFSYEIVDLTGRTISRGKSSGTIDVVGLSKGVYVLKLNYAEQQTCIRFVKQ